MSNSNQNANKNSGFSCSPCKWITFGILASIAALLVLIVPPAIRNSVSPYSNVLLRNTVTGTVDTSKVIRGPTNIFQGFTEQIEFNRTFHFIDFRDGSTYGRFGVSTKSTRTVTFDALLLVRIPADSIPNIYLQYTTEEDGVLPEVAKRAIEVVKNTAPQFNISDYMQKRDTVETVFSDAIRNELKNISVEIADHGFHLRRFYLPSDVYQRYLDASIQDELAETRKFEHDAFKIRVATNKTVEQKLAEALKVREETGILANNLVVQANATAKKTLETAESQGLKKVIDVLGIAGKPDLINKLFLYIRTIDGQIDPHVVSGNTNVLVNLK